MEQRGMSNPVAAFLLGLAAGIVIRSMISAVSRYWLYTRPLNRLMREQVRECIDPSVKPLWPNDK